jgi:hypothetical protein
VGGQFGDLLVLSVFHPINALDTYLLYSSLLPFTYVVSRLVHPSPLLLNMTMILIPGPVTLDNYNLGIECKVLRFDLCMPSNQSTQMLRLLSSHFVICRPPLYPGILFDVCIMSFS